MGKLFAGEEPYVYPCTPKGILLLLDEYKIKLEGKNVVVIGRSNLVGKPVAQMLLKRNATVTMCHSHTKNLSDITKTADIIVSAVGKNVIGEKMLKSDCVVIDVGILETWKGKSAAMLILKLFQNRRIYFTCTGRCRPDDNSIINA